MYRRIYYLAERLLKCTAKWTLKFHIFELQHRGSVTRRSVLITTRDMLSMSLQPPSYPSYPNSFHPTLRESLPSCRLQPWGRIGLACQIWAHNVRTVSRREGRSGSNPGWGKRKGNLARTGPHVPLPATQRTRSEGCEWYATNDELTWHDKAPQSMTKTTKTTIEFISDMTIDIMNLCTNWTKICCRPYNIFYMNVTHCGLLTSYAVTERRQHWFR